MSEIPDDIWKAAEAAAKLIIAAEELKVDSYRVYDAATVIANAILAERQKNADLLKRTGDVLIIENPHSPTGELLLSLASAILSPAEKETE
jgi:hypothetical protein